MITPIESLLAQPPGSLVESELGKKATQYREAERLIGYMRAVLGQIEVAARAIHAIPDAFDIDSSVGDQLTLIGKRMGFSRCHCVCDATPLYGFVCDDAPSLIPLVGPCEEGSWLGCDGVTDLCISDDEVFRAHLYARRYQMLGLFDIDSLTTALRTIWGPTAWVPEASRGLVTIAPGRALTAAEAQRLSITARVLPIAPGMSLGVHLGSSPILGFGEGWAGPCETPPGVMLCPTILDPYACS